MKKIVLFISFFLFSAIYIMAETVLFDDDFTNQQIWPNASGVNSLKSTETSFGTVKYLNLSVYPTTQKTYSSVTKIGYIDFNKGSSTISDENSYIELPEMTFTNGGVFNIVYGAGSTKKYLQLQELIDGEWSNENYEPISTVKSSVWYNYNWIITGAGKKTFRLVLSSSSHIYVSDIKVTANSPFISTLADTLNFGTLLLNDSSITKPLDVEGVALTSNIYADVSGQFRVRNDLETGSYSSSYVDRDGGTFYVSFNPIYVGCYLDSIMLSSSGAMGDKVYLKASVVEKTSVSDNNKYSSISVKYLNGGIEMTSAGKSYYFVYNIKGNLITKGSFYNSIYISLPKNIYIVKIGNLYYNKIVVH